MDGDLFPVDPCGDGGAPGSEVEEDVGYTAGARGAVEIGNGDNGGYAGLRSTRVSPKAHTKPAETRKGIGTHHLEHLASLRPPKSWRIEVAAVFSVDLSKHWGDPVYYQNCLLSKISIVAGSVQPQDV